MTTEEILENKTVMQEAKLCQQYHDIYGGNNVSAFIDGFKYATENPLWVRVDEAMPPCDENTFDAYLVRTSQKTKSQPHGAIHVALYTDEGFHIESHHAIDEITHWMPLPRQPKN